jgi:adenylate cyclase
MIRVTAQLLAAGTGAAVWAERYDRQDAELFAVQDELVQRIVTSLEVKLTDRERQTLARIPTRNLEAHDLYLRAEYQNVGLTEPESLVRSVAAYRRAIDLDPRFAEAYAGLARAATTIWRRDYSEIMSSAMARQEAYAAAGRALELDPENARAYEVLSIIQVVEGARQVAVASARKAVDLQPSDAEAHTNLANVLYVAGDLAAAQEEVALARRLNPALPSELRLVSASVAFAQKRYADAVAEFTDLGASVPRNEMVLEHLAAAYAYLGDDTKARAAVAELKEVLPITNLGFYRVLGQGIGTHEQAAHFIEGLRRAGIPEWPYGDQRPLADRLGGDDLRALVSGRTWEGALKNGVRFVQFFDPEGEFAYRSPSSLLSGRVTVEDDRLCQVFEGYLLNRPTCGYVYRNAADASNPGLTYAYVSIDALKYFSVSP